MNDHSIAESNTPQPRRKMPRSKRLKLLLLGFLAVSIALLAVFEVYEFLTLDSTAPVITCPDGVLEVSIHAGDEELLAGVTAQDDQDGDVTADVVVEKLSAMGRDNTREATLAVMDQSGNVSRAERTLHYTDYEPPRILLDKPLLTSKREQAWPLLDSIQASSTLDGDLSARVKYSLLESNYISDYGVYPVELRISDSTGTSLVIPTTLEVFDGRSESIPVQLNQYIVYLHQNDPFDPDDYFGPPQEDEDPDPDDQDQDPEPLLRKDQTLTVDSNVDTSVPGVYHVTYTVENETAKTMGRSRLIVVVEA